MPINILEKSCEMVEDLNAMNAANCATVPKAYQTTSKRIWLKMVKHSPRLSISIFIFSVVDEEETESF